MKIWELDQLIKTACPIDGISSKGYISFRVEATPEQRMAAQELMNAHLSELEDHP
jgi:hypothetical protein